jgi:hypothetical protein
MSSLLIRRDYLYYSANIRCEDAAQLAELETRLITEQSGKSAAQRLRDLDWPQTPPPAEMPESLRDFVALWEALLLRKDCELSKIIHLAQPSSQASHIGVDLLGQRPDAFEVMLRALRSDDKLWQGAGFALARESQGRNEELADVIIDILTSLPLEPLPDVPGRIVSCQRFEALLVLIADLKLATPKVFDTLTELQRRLIRRDSWLVKYITIIVRELKGEPPIAQPMQSYLP